MKIEKYIIEKNRLETVVKLPLSLVVIVACIILLLASIVLLTLQAKHQASMYQTAIPTSIPQSTFTTNPALATSVLSFNKNDSSVDVYLDTGKTPVSGVQFALSYNPQVLINVQVTPGTFFDTPVVLQNSVDDTKGIIYYTMALKPGDQPKKGQGIIATISYTVAQEAQQSTTLRFLPQTKITSEGINSSILKKTTTITLP